MSDKVIDNQILRTAVDWIENACCDVRCINVPTGGDDYDVEWIVIGHYEAQPKEREIGRGKTILEAIKDAMNV